MVMVFLCFKALQNQYTVRWLYRHDVSKVSAVFEERDCSYRKRSRFRMSNSRRTCSSDHVVSIFPVRICRFRFKKRAKVCL